MKSPGGDLPAAHRFLFDDAAAYEQMMGRWSALVAAPFLDWLALPHGLAWLDDGCGNGAFTEILVRRQRPATVVGVDPAPAQLAFARERPLAAEVRFVDGDALALPLPDASVDATVMALLLFFLPDPAQGVREAVRVTRPGGVVAAYHWDMAGGGFPLQAIVDAACAEGYVRRMPPSTWAAATDASAALWRDAGLVAVSTARIEVSRNFDRFDDLWRTTDGSPQLRDFLAALAPSALDRLRERVREQLGVSGDGPVTVTAWANAVQGRTPRIADSH